MAALMRTLYTALLTITHCYYRMISASIQDSVSQYLNMAINIFVTRQVLLKTKAIMSPPYVTGWKKLFSL